MLVELALLSLSFVGSSTDAPKDPEPSCQSWSGTVSGNDPSVSVVGTLCEDAKGNVTGQLTWTSARSGSNVRKVDGAWNGDHTTLRMRDGAIVESHPNPGWRFCVVDEYVLSGSKDALAGQYRSSGCNDTASITLRRS